MIGPPLDGRGGMSSVSAAYREAGLFERCGVRFLASATGRSGAVAKLWVALRAWCVLLGLLVLRRVDLAHVHVASGASFWRKAIYLLTLELAGVPVVLHVHGGNFVEFYGQASPRAQSFIRARFARAARVILLSQVWIARMGAIVEASRCRAIGNPVLAWPVQREPRPVRVFLFLGRFEQDKGIFELLEAFALLRQQVPEARLLLGGDGDSAAVDRIAAEHGMQGAVQRLGWVSGEAKRAAFDQADALVLPSYIEGLPVAMLEAMSCGMPVVVSDVGSIPEVVNDGVNGLMVPPRQVPPLAEAMLKLALQSELAQGLGAAGRAAFDAGFEAHGVSEQVARLYAEVLAAAAGQR